MSVVGARWWKFDFHTHTPASFDYGKGDVSVTDRTPRDWLQDYVDHGIECVAVTDHNSGAWVDRLKSAALEMREEGISIYIFPGVEVTASSNIHVLAILDPSSGSADIESIVGATKFRGKRGDSSAVAELSAEAVVKEVLEIGGVAIPAHIDMKSGLCQQNSSLTIEQVCRRASAVEIIHPDREGLDAPLSRYKNLGLKMSSVIGSDSHHPNRVGQAYTWVKMSEPSIEGLRLALIDGDSSLIRSDHVIRNPNQHSNIVIHSITVKNAKYAGRPGPLILRFNPWLNSIIGGRGSGKSSMLEFIRIGMDRSRDLIDLGPENEVRKSFLNFMQESTSRDSDGVMRNDTEISCVYVRDDVHYRLDWFMGGDVSISRYDGEGWVSEEGDAHARFPIKIFSQKQIFNLAKNPSALFRLIDESSAVDYYQWKMEWQDKCNYFGTICSQKREVVSKLQNKSTYLGQLADVEQKIKAIERSGHTAVLSNYQACRKKKENVDNCRSYVQDLKDAVDSAVNSFPEFDLSVDGFDSSHMYDSEMVESLRYLLSSANELKVDILNRTKEFDEKLKGFDLWYASSSFNKQTASAEQGYQALISDLGNHGVNSPSDYAALIEQKETIVRNLSFIKELEVELASIDHKLNSAYADLVECRKKLTKSRTEFLARNLSNNAAIRINIKPLSDTENLEGSFREMLGRQDGAFSAEIYDPERERGFLYTLHSSLAKQDPVASEDSLQPYFSLVHEFKEQLFNYKSGEVLGNKLGKRFAGYMDNLQPRSYDFITTWFPEDKLEIRFNDGNRFKDVSQGSAGQKASAILSFLLSYGSEPLVLDQPEDDLDNGLITSLIVAKLQENKASRQIIIVTHNPNIVVNGDSEYVIALEDQGQIRVRASGALQEVDVRKNVCEIMEGGEVALQQRYRRMMNI